MIEQIESSMKYENSSIAEDKYDRKGKKRERNKSKKRKAGIGNEGKERFFCCERCGKVAKTKQALERHAAYHNSERPFSCQMCRQRFKNSDDLGKHLRRLRRDGKYEHACIVCHKHFKNDSLLVKHVEMLGCDKQKETSTEKDLEETTVEHDTDDKIRAGTVAEKEVKCFCKDCNEEFCSTESLKCHYKDLHKDNKRHVCRQCGQTLSSKDSLMRHYSIFHQNEYPFQCEHCLQKFKVKESLCRHVKFIHKDGGYKCEICQRIFSQPVNLKKHMAVHSMHKEYACEVCEKEFRWKQSLQKHMLLHPDSSKIRVKSHSKRMKKEDSGSIGDVFNVQTCALEHQDIETSEQTLELVQKASRDQPDILIDYSDDDTVYVDLKLGKDSCELEVKRSNVELQRLYDMFDEDTIDNSDLTHFDRKNCQGVTDSSEKASTCIMFIESGNELKRKSDRCVGDQNVDEFELVKKRKQDDGSLDEVLEAAPDITGDIVDKNIAQKELGNLQRYSNECPDEESDKLDFLLDDFDKSSDDKTSEEIDPFLDSNYSVQGPESGGENISLKNHENSSRKLSEEISESSIPALDFTTSQSRLMVEEPPKSSSSLAKLTFRPSSISCVFASTDSIYSKNEKTSSHKMSVQGHKKPVQGHKLSVPGQSGFDTSNSNEENSRLSVKKLENGFSRSPTEIDANLVRVPSSRPQPSPSPSGIGKFSLIKHMLSLQNEEHFDKSVFDNPFKIKPSNMKSLQRIADMHKLSDDKDKYCVSVKQNIPFQWLGVSSCVRKDQKGSESSIMREKENTTNSLTAGADSRNGSDGGQRSVQTEKDCKQSNESNNGVTDRDRTGCDSVISSYQSVPSGPLFITCPVSTNANKSQYSEASCYETSSSNLQDQVALNLSTVNTRPDSRNGFVTIPASSDPEVLSTAKNSGMRDLNTGNVQTGLSSSEIACIPVSSAKSFGIPVKFSGARDMKSGNARTDMVSESYDQLRSKSVDTKRFCGFQAMKSLVQYSQANRDKGEKTTIPAFFSLKNPFIRNSANIPSTSFENHTNDYAQSKFDMPRTYESEQSYYSTKALLKDNNISRISRSSSSSSSSISSTMVEKPTLGSVYSLPSVSPTMFPSVLSPMPNSSSASLPFTALVSVAASLHQSTEMQSHCTYPVHGLSRSIDHSSAYLDKNLVTTNASVNQIQTSSVYPIDRARMATMVQGSSSGDQRVVGSEMVGGGVCNVSVLDLLQSPERGCSGFQMIDHLLDACIN